MRGGRCCHLPIQPPFILLCSEPYFSSFNCIYSNNKHLVRGTYYTRKTQKLHHPGLVRNKSFPLFGTGAARCSSTMPGSSDRYSLTLRKPAHFRSIFRLMIPYPAEWSEWSSVSMGRAPATSHPGSNLQELAPAMPISVSGSCTALGGF